MRVTIISELNYNYIIINKLNQFKNVFSSGIISELELSVQKLIPPEV